MLELVTFGRSFAGNTLSFVHNAPSSKVVFVPVSVNVEAQVDRMQYCILRRRVLLLQGRWLRRFQRVAVRELQKNGFLSNFGSVGNENIEGFSKSAFFWLEIIERSPRFQQSKHGGLEEAIDVVVVSFWKPIPGKVWHGFVIGRSKNSTKPTSVTVRAVRNANVRFSSTRRRGFLQEFAMVCAKKEIEITPLFEVVSTMDVLAYLFSEFYSPGNDFDVDDVIILYKFQYSYSLHNEAFFFTSA
ncbi:hypothetical protein EDB85DRAFT_1899858 [Lactarius pseudohatsudake]|nr:hypothetical protein EDB85DRAFT_1899858 [Lactarius pseudohatsudake]